MKLINYHSEKQRVEVKKLMKRHATFIDLLKTFP